MPDDLFAPLGEGPVPPMAGAADIRARGDQRQRRSRAVLAGTGALVLVLAGVAAVSATGGGGRDQVLPAEPAPSTSPQGCPDQPTSTGPADVRCDTAPAPIGLAASLLTTQDVAAVRGGTWDQRRTEDLPFPVLPAGCQDGDAVGGPGGEPVSGTAGTFLNGPDDAVVGHTLVEYRDEADAVLALGVLIDAVEACDGQVPGWTLAGGLPGTSADRVYGELVTADEQLPFAVQRVGAVLSAVQVRGAPFEEMPALADIAVRRLTAILAPGTPAREAPPTFDVTAAFLSPEAAAAAELPGWAINEAYSPQPGPLLDPCGDGVVGDQVVASGERSMGSAREAGGSGLVQEVYAYTDEQAAAAALAQYADRVRACPVKPAGPDVPDTITSDIAESGPDRFLVRNRYCNPACTDIFTTYAYVAQAGTGLTVATYAVGEDGDPADDARSLLGPIVDALVRAVDAG